MVECWTIKQEVPISNLTKGIFFTGRNVFVIPKKVLAANITNFVYYTVKTRVL